MQFDVLDEKDDVIATCLTFIAYYVMPDGAQISMRQEIAWCATCRDFSACEEFPSVSQIESELEAEFEHRRQNEYCGGTLRQYVDAALSQLQPWISLAQERKSPPRCLTCSRTNLLRLGHATAHEPYGALSHRWRHLHPLTSSPISIVLIAHVGDCRVGYYTPEGIELPFAACRLLHLF